MINTTNPILIFSLKLLGALVVLFGIHIFILNYLETPLFNNLIIVSYSLNYALAIIIFAALYLLRKKYLDSLGFIFMAGSMLKFAFYFIFFYPTFKQNGTIEGQESASFLVPYAMCLLLETIYVSKLLNNKL